MIPRIVKTTGIAMRVIPTANTSAIVSWLTPDCGRISTMIKGARRPKSRFLGQYDLFYTCEVLFYARENRDLHIAYECSPLKMRRPFRRNWKAAAMASYFTDIVSRISPVHAAHAATYHLLDEALDDLGEHGAVAPHTFWFELKLLEVMGLAPRLQHCLDCSRLLEPGRDVAGFSTEKGGLVCMSCGSSFQKPPSRLTPDVFAALRGLQRARHAVAARSVRCSPRQTVEIANLLGHFLAYHLDVPLVSRDIALKLLG